MFRIRPKFTKIYYLEIKKVFANEKPAGYIFTIASSKKIGKIWNLLMRFRRINMRGIVLY